MKHTTFTLALLTLACTTRAPIVDGPPITPPEYTEPTPDPEPDSSEVTLVRADAYLANTLGQVGAHAVLLETTPSEVRVEGVPVLKLDVPGHMRDADSAATVGRALNELSKKRARTQPYYRALFFERQVPHHTFQRLQLASESALRPPTQGEAGQHQPPKTARLMIRRTDGDWDAYTVETSDLSATLSPPKTQATTSSVTFKKIILRVLPQGIWVVERPTPSTQNIVPPIAGCAAPGPTLCMKGSLTTLDDERLVEVYRLRHLYNTLIRLRDRGPAIEIHVDASAPMGLISEVLKTVRAVRPGALANGTFATNAAFLQALRAAPPERPILTKDTLFPNIVLNLPLQLASP